MYHIGQKIILRLHPEGVYLSDDVYVSRRSVQVGVEPAKPYSPHPDIFWMGARVVGYLDGILECELSGHPGRVNSFFSQHAEEGAVTKLILMGGEILKRLSGGNQSMPEWVRPRSGSTVRSPQATNRKTSSPSVLQRQIPEPESAPPEPRNYPIVEHKQEYKFRFDEMQIVDGAALFNAYFEIPRYRRPVSLELRVENNFLRSEFDSIKSYLSNCLKRKTIDVKALVRCQGPEILSVEAESDVVAKINASLLDDVRYRYIRRELRKDDEDANIVTVDDLFKKVKDSGLQPNDRQFIDDLIDLKKPKHSENIKLLSSMHLFDLDKVRVQKYPFGFVFFVSGKQGCFFVLETLDRKDATYLWKLGATKDELRQNPALLSELYATVEQEITIVADEGRDPYLKDTPDNFCRVRHDYESANGFETWKSRLSQVLDGEG